MNEKYLTEVMHAYAAGCLDHEDLIPFLELLESNGQITNPDFGELQNLTSLLPAILMIEAPPASVKDNIARKLYAIREEMIVKRTLEEEIPEPENKAPETPSEELFTSKYYEKVQPEPETEAVKAEPVSQPVEERFPAEKPAYQSKRSELYEDIPPAVEKKESKGTLIALIVIFILLIAGASFGVYYLMQQKINEQQKNITAVRSDIKVLNDEIVRLNKVQRILAILGSKDVSTINLDGTIDNPTGFGKIVFDPVNKEGLLSLFNMPPLPKDKTYQLWLLSKGQPFSLGLYTPLKDADRYIPINEFPDILLNNIDAFLLTMEDAGGSDSPKGTVYLHSSVKH